MTDTRVVKNEEVPQYVVAETIEAAVINNDLSKLDAQGRVTYYRQLCESLGINWLTRPFGYLTLNGKLTLYANKDAAEQLRNKNCISIEKPDIRFEEDWIIVTVAAHDATGRTDSDVGVVNRKDMQGNFGNALMKAVTKAKRRVTLSICGLGMLDETEVETIPQARVVEIEQVEQPAHWIDDDAKRRAFWAQVQKRGISDIEMHKLMELSSVRDWTGTAADLLKALDAKLAQKTA